MGKQSAMLLHGFLIQQKKISRSKKLKPEKKLETDFFKGDLLTLKESWGEVLWIPQSSHFRAL